MKSTSWKVLSRHFGEQIIMSCRLQAGDTFYRTISNRILDVEGNSRPDQAELFAPNCRIITFEEAMERMMA